MEMEKIVSGQTDIIFNIMLLKHYIQPLLNQVSPTEIQALEVDLTETHDELSGCSFRELSVDAAVRQA